MALGFHELSCDQFRDFYAKALKFVIPDANWNSNAPNTYFDSNKNVLTYQKSFNEFSKEHMLRTNSVLIKELKKWVKFDRGLDKIKIKNRLRKKRISIVYRAGIKELKKRCKNEVKPLQGITLFTFSVKRFFLNKKNGTDPHYKLPFLDRGKF
jgi:hypothetical protein